MTIDRYFLFINPFSHYWGIKNEKVNTDQGVGLVQMMNLWGLS